MKVQPLVVWFMIGTLVPPLCAGAAPASVRGGRVTDTTVIDGQVQWVDLEAALLAEQIEAGGAIPEDARTFRSPEAGNEFVVLSVSLRPGFSVGRMDYKVRLGGRSHDCLALAVDDGPFDPRRLEVKAESAPETARLLFEVPEGAAKAQLIFALPTTLGLPDVPLTLRETTPEPADEAAADVPRDDEPAEGDGEPEGSDVANDPEPAEKPEDPATEDDAPEDGARAPEEAADEPVAEPAEEDGNDGEEKDDAENPWEGLL